MPKPLLHSLLVWFACSLVAYLISQTVSGNSFWDSQTTEFETTVGLLACAIGAFGYFFPGFVAGSRSLDSRKNILKLAAVVSSPIGLMLFGSYLQQATIIEALCFGSLLWGLFVGISFLMLSWAAMMARLVKKFERSN